jgi:hypothetical protein
MAVGGVGSSNSTAFLNRRQNDASKGTVDAFPIKNGPITGGSPGAPWQSADVRAHPGSEMAGKTYSVPAGGTLRFAAGVNQIYGVLGVKAGAPANVSSTELYKGAQAGGNLGDPKVNRWDIKIPQGTPAGTKINVSTSSPYMATRGPNAPNWNYNFTIVVGQPQS